MKTDFNWQGFAEDKILAMSTIKKEEQPSSLRYWVSEAYSSGLFLRKYAFYPSFLNLCCYSSHGIHYILEIEEHEVETDAPFMLFYDLKRLAKYKELTDKPAYKVPAPMPWLRRHYNINQTQEAKGTLAFFAHSSPEVNFGEQTRQVVDKFIDELLALPEQMHPVCVCLHTHDITNDTYKYFLERNIPIYTAGHYLSKNFAYNFYTILQNFKFTTGMTVGSNTWYCVEMGIPFFLHGTFTAYTYEEKPYTYLHNEHWHNARKLFSQFTPTVTEEQKKATEELVGESKSISRTKLSCLLYKAFFKHTLKRKLSFLYKILKGDRWKF